MSDLVEMFNFVQEKNVHTYYLVMTSVSGCNFNKHLYEHCLTH